MVKMEFPLIGHVFAKVQIPWLQCHCLLNIVLSWFTVLSSMCTGKRSDWRHVWS